MIDPALVGGFVTTVGKSSLVSALRDGVVNFLADRAKDAAGKELKERIESLRSDAKLNKEIQKALERAAQRWAEDSPDDELIAAVVKNTAFIDLPSIQKAIREIARNPFTKTTAQTLHGGFRDVLPARFDEERIERNVNEFINILREEFAAIPALQPTLRTFASLNAANVAAVLPNIEKLLEQLINEPTATDETLHNYLTWVIDQHRYLDPKGTMQTTRQVQVLLDEVYVSLEAEEEEPLSGMDRKLYEEELKALEAREDLRPEEREDFLENLQAKFIRAKERKASGKPVELAELIHQHEKMVILGDPGAGKTTLLRYLALKHAQAKRQSLSTTEELGEVFLPVYLRIAEYAENSNGQSLEDFLITNVRGREHSDTSLSDLIRRNLQAGGCIVLLDGLDEVIEPDQRALISAQINSLIRSLEAKGNRSVVTSRVAGYRTAPLDGNIPHYRVRDMNLDQIKRFLRQWCSAVERFQTPALAPETQQANAQKEMDGIIHAIESNAGVRRLAANPLLLRTLALIHKTGARIPQRRIELYRLAADTLIRDWNLAKGIPQAALAREADANRLLAELAAWMHENRPAGLAAEGDIKQKLCEAIAPLRGKDADHPDVQTEADDFLDKIRRHTGLFVERAPKRFGFMHLTFEEYFAARWLAARPKEAAKRIRSKLHRPRWEEPILLAIGHYGMEFPDDVTELVEEAILGKDLGGPSPYEETLFRDLLFAVRAAGDQDVDIRLQDKLAEQFTALWLDRDGKGKYQTIQTRAQTIMKEIQDSQMGQKIVTALLAALKDEDKVVRARAAEALRNATQYPEAVAVLLAALKDEDEGVRAGAAWALGNATQNPEAVAALLAALKDEDKWVCARAAEALGNATQNPEAVAALLAALKDEDEGVRAGAAWALGNAAHYPEAVTALLAALKDEDEGVRARAAEALRNATQYPEAVAALLAALKDEDKWVRARAAEALGNATQYPEAVAALLAALKDEHERVRASAALALGNATQYPEAVAALLAALKDEDKVVRAGAAWALRNAAHYPEAVAALLAALKDEHERVRARAAWALGNATQYPEAVTALLAALKDEHERVRASAALALGNATQYPEAVTALLAALKDEHEGVRAGAAWALGNATQYPEAVTALLAALKDEDKWVRAGAAWALGNAAHYPEAVTALLAALKDEDEGVRARAAEALREITTRFSLSALPDLPDKLKTALEYSGLDDWSFYGNEHRRACDLIFDSLNAIAPSPKV